MSSVAFWYQTEPHKPWPALPAGPERLPFREHTLAVGYRQVPEARHSEAPLEVQPIGGATDGKQLWFRPADEKGWVEVTFNVPKDMTAELWLKTTHAKDYGTYRVKLDGKSVGTLDLFNANITPTPHRLGVQTLTAGEHTLRFEGAGKSEKSTGYLLGFDALAARVAAYARPPGFDLRKIQK
jgi:hypothetical protein